jgi:hypothetical protein
MPISRGDLDRFGLLGIEYQYKCPNDPFRLPIEMLLSLLQYAIL